LKNSENSHFQYRMHTQKAIIPAANLAIDAEINGMHSKPAARQSKLAVLKNAAAMTRPAEM
jgi:hypothetical protein